MNREQLRDLLAVAIDAGVEALAAGLAEVASPAGPLRMVPPESLHVDARRFQFRLSTINLSGTDGRLRDACRWNPALAGVLLVWPEGDRLNLIDGHHRLRLAIASGAEQVAVLLIEAKDAAAARIVGGLSNLAHGSATPADVAKLMRDAGMSAADVARHGVSPRSRLLQAASALVPLDDRLFAKVASGELSPEVGAALAAAGPAAVQRDLAREAARRKWDADQIYEAAQLARLATVSSSTPTDCLPGFEALLQVEGSNLTALLGIRAAIRRQLRDELRALSVAASRRHASTLESAGVAVIDAEAAAEHRDFSRAQSRVFDLVAGTTGPLQTLIRDLAGQVSERRPAAAIVAERLAEIRAAIEAEFGWFAGG